MAKKWMNEMGFTWKQIPNMEAHSQADEKHSDMFLPFLKEYATGEKERTRDPSGQGVLGIQCDVSRRELQRRRRKVQRSE